VEIKIKMKMKIEIKMPPRVYLPLAGKSVDPARRDCNCNKS
jgi:hypothetical protein